MQSALQEKRIKTMKIKTERIKSILRKGKAVLRYLLNMSTVLAPLRFSGRLFQRLWA
jgi:hypothetical protein